MCEVRYTKPVTGRWPRAYPGSPSGVQCSGERMPRAHASLGNIRVTDGGGRAWIAPTEELVVRRVTECPGNPYGAYRGRPEGKPSRTFKSPVFTDFTTPASSCPTTAYVVLNADHIAGGASLIVYIARYRTSRSSVSCVTTRSIVTSSACWYACFNASRLAQPPACARSTSGRPFRVFGSFLDCRAWTSPPPRTGKPLPLVSGPSRSPFPQARSIWMRKRQGGAVAS